MKVKELLNYFRGPKPIVEAAAFLGLHPATIKNWEEAKDGIVPMHWEALFNEKKLKEKQND